jgi:hypothetical protein
MSDLISKTREKILIWWLVILKMLLFTLVSLACGIATALYGVNWDQLTPQEKFVVICLIFGNWGNVMMAFIDRAASRVAGGQLPISDDDSQLISNPPPKSAPTVKAQ